MVDYLLGQSGIAALVANRIYPDCFPQSEQLPAIAYTLEDDASQQTQQCSSGTREAIYQISIRADTRRDVMAVARELRLVLDGHRGVFKDIPITGAFLDSLSRERDENAYRTAKAQTISAAIDAPMLRPSIDAIDNTMRLARSACQCPSSRSWPTKQAGSPHPRAGIS